MRQGPDAGVASVSPAARADCAASWSALAGNPSTSARSRSVSENALVASSTWFEKFVDSSASSVWISLNPVALCSLEADAGQPRFADQQPHDVLLGWVEPAPFRSITKRT